MKRQLLILNPCSGKKRANRALAEIVSIFNRGGYDVTVYTTAARGDATQVAASRCREFDCVVCAGGDGTFNEVVSGVYAAGSDTPIGYIPAGSTNDFASSTHLSRNLLQAARDIVEGEPRTLDLGSFNGRCFSYVASFGAFTRASYATSQSVKISPPCAIPSGLRLSCASLTSTTLVPSPTSVTTMWLWELKPSNTL